MPGRKWYAVAGIVFLGGAALCAVFLVSRLGDLAGALGQVVVPGEAEVTLHQPGTYTIFHEHESVVGGRYYSSPEEIPGLRVQLVSAETGEPVPLREPTGTVSYSIGGRSGVSIFSFEIEEPGTYRLSAGFEGGDEERQVVLAVGQGFGSKLTLTILGTLAMGFAAFVIAATIAAATFWKRRKASRAAHASSPP